MADCAGGIAVEIGRYALVMEFREGVMQKENHVKIDGAFFLSFLNACEKLKLLLNIDHETFSKYRIGAWYNVEEFMRLLSSLDCYLYREVIIERIGEQMAQLWYDDGLVKNLISSGFDFVRLQTGSAGYKIVVQGPEENIGKFELLTLDEKRGVAVIRTTTIFPNALERGLLYGGLGLVGDLLYYDVQDSNEKDNFELRFVTSENRLSIPWYNGAVLEEAEWRLQHITNKFSRRESYLSCINDTLNMAYVEMKASASIDHLTGINNRREFFRLSEMEFEKAVRHSEPLSLLYLDLDNFKQINDKYGHDVGDRVLVAFAKICETSGRKYDIPGRIGGEEFALALPRETIKVAISVAEKILEKTRELSIPLKNGSLKFTVSIGVVEFDAQKSFDLLLKHADEQLFLAKGRGRDQIASAHGKCSKVFEHGISKKG